MARFFLAVTCILTDKILLSETGFSGELEPEISFIQLSVQPVPSSELDSSNRSEMRYPQEDDDEDEGLFKRAMMYSPTDSDHLKLGNSKSAGDTIWEWHNETAPCAYSKVDKAHTDFEYLKNEHIQSWEHVVVDEAETHCNLPRNETFQKRLVTTGADMALARQASRLVIDYSGNNAHLRCAMWDPWMDGERETMDPIGFSNVTRFRASTGREFLTSYRMPDKCKRDSEEWRGPCPLLVALPGAMGDITAEEASKYAKCNKDNGVVTLMVRVDKELDKANGKEYCSMEDVDFLRPLVEGFMAKHSESLDPHQVMLFGQSMGATAAVWGAILSPDIFTQVFAVSPKSFWRPGLERRPCVVEGIEPQYDYDAFLKFSVPLSKKRMNQNRKLKKLIVFAGSEDMLVEEEEGGEVDFKVIPSMLADLGFSSAGVQTEMRVYPSLGHACWVAAWNELFDVAWRGMPPPPPKVGRSILETFMIIACFAAARLAYLLVPGVLSAMGESGGAAGACETTVESVACCVGPEHVKVEISEGSVVCKMTVSPPDGVAISSVHIALSDRQSSLVNDVVQRINGMAGIKKATEGQVSIEDSVKPEICESQVSLTMKVRMLSHAKLVGDSELLQEFIACMKKSVSEHSVAAPKNVNPSKSDFPSLVSRANGIETFLSLLRPDSQTMALGSTDGRQALSHAELHKLAVDVDLSRFGIASQSNVATVMPGGDTSAALLVVLFARYAVSPLNANLRADELKMAVTMFESQAVITTAELAPFVVGLLPDGIPLIIVTPDVDQAGKFSLSLHGSDGGQQRVELDEMPMSRLNGPDDIVLLLGTSGTTSAPKVVPATLHRLALGAMTWADSFYITDVDVGLNVMPLYHIGGIITNVVSLLINGAGLVCAPSLKNPDTMDWLRRWKITYFSSVPTVHAQLLAIYDDTEDKSGIKLHKIATGAAHIPHALAVSLREGTKASVLSTYGMSECMPMAIAPYDSTINKKESVGQPVCGELGLFTEDGKQSKPSESGEVCVKGPLLMKSYLAGGKMSLHDGGWFRTGDLGKFDNDGWLYLIGRSKEVINRGGELISPFEIDSAASQIPGVKHCLSFAVHHSELGEAVGLAVVCEESVSPDEIKSFLSAVLTAPKVPELIVYMPYIPKGPTGKPKRIEMGGLLGVKLSVATGRKDRNVQAEESADGRWTLSPVSMDEGEDDLGVDSLGFARKHQSDDDLHLQACQQALYGICAMKLMWQHWLPPYLNDSIHGHFYVRHFMETIIHCRTLLVMIFPLLGFFDGVAVAGGDHPLKRAPVVFAVYALMSWPLFYALPMMGWAEGYATFHRWPIIIWLLCMLAIVAYRAAGIPAWFQVLLPLALAPVFRNTVDSLHGLMGLEESPPQGALSDPSLILLEHSFWWSVGAKLYFSACYFFAFHYLVPVSKSVVACTKAPNVVRALALAGFCLITVAWQTLNVANDPMQVHEELSDWPEFLGLTYPFQIAIDWATMILLVVAVGKGVYLLRLMGESILGTMVSHMYFSLPFPIFLQAALHLGGVAGALLAFVTVPIVWVLSVGAGFQWSCFKLVDLVKGCYNSSYLDECKEWLDGVMKGSVKSQK